MDQKKGLFSVGEEFDKGFWEIVKRRRFFYKEECSPDSPDRLYDDYLWLKSYLMRRSLADKPPTSLLDSQGHPLMKDVCALRHFDRETAWSLEKEYDQVTSVESTDAAITDFAQKVNSLRNAPKPVFYYKLSPEDYFVLYDVPQLMYLYTRHRLQSDIQTILQTDCPEIYERIFDNKKKEHNNSWFGVNILHSTKSNKVDTITVPAFCGKGRLEAFYRFITWGKNAKRVHTFKYLTRCLPPRRELESVSDFRDEDAWYYEMCTGLSLTAEITALLVELGIKSCDIRNDDQAKSTWSECRLGLFGRLLQNHRESMTKCPAIYWRNACLRNVIRQTDYQCRIKELKYKQQISLAYTDTLPENYPQTSGEWYIFAKQEFEKYFNTDLELIGDERMNSRFQQFSKATNIGCVENPFPNLMDPDECNYMTSAKEIAEQLLTTTPNSGNTIEYVMRNAVIVPNASCCQDTNFYFRGCLPIEDNFLEEMMHVATIPLYHPSENGNNGNSLKKLRSTNEYEKIFEFIHEKLYGGNNDQDLGFLQPAGL